MAFHTPSVTFHTPYIDLPYPPMTFHRPSFDLPSAFHEPPIDLPRPSTRCLQVGFASAIDLGDLTSPAGSIHPRRKQEVRLTFHDYP